MHGHKLVPFRGRVENNFLLKKKSLFSSFFFCTARFPENQSIVSRTSRVKAGVLEKEQQPYNIFREGANKFLCLCLCSDERFLELVSSNSEDLYTAAARQQMNPGHLVVKMCVCINHKLNFVPRLLKEKKVR